VVDSSLVQEGFLLDHEPCGGLRSSLELVIGSIGFWQKFNRFIKLSRVALSFTLCLNSRNTSLPNIDWFESALSLLMILMRFEFVPLVQIARGSHVPK
jgi:hypothetical protein